MAGYVYLIGSSHYKWYKIGRTANSTIRLADLRVLMPFPVEIVTIIKCQSDAYVERFLHLKYKEFHLNGEWFSFHRNQLRYVVLEMHLHGEHQTEEGHTWPKLAFNKRLDKLIVLSELECEDRKARAIASRRAKQREKRMGKYFFLRAHMPISETQAQS